MNAPIVYDSEFGNTGRIAREIEEALTDLHPARAVPVGEASTLGPRRARLAPARRPSRRTSWHPKVPSAKGRG